MYAKIKEMNIKNLKKFQNSLYEMKHCSKSLYIDKDCKRRNTEIS